MSKINLIRNIGILIVSAACFVACTPEEYAPCSIPNTTSHKAACAPMGDSRTATCVADYVFDCDSLMCGIYNSSAPFCTQRCIPTKAECEANATDKAKCTNEGSNGVSYLKCPEGKECVNVCPDGAACVEWTPGTGGFFCLPNDKRGVGNYTPPTPPTNDNDNNNSGNEGNDNTDNNNGDNTGNEGDNTGSEGGDNTGSEGGDDAGNEDGNTGSEGGDDAGNEGGDDAGNEGGDNTGDNPGSDAGDETTPDDSSSDA